MNIQIQDKNVLNVMARFKERSEVGIKKYKTTLERTDLTTLEWLQHAQEEAWTLFFTWSDLNTNIN
jgi:hypothetical protein